MNRTDQIKYSFYFKNSFYSTLDPTDYFGLTRPVVFQSLKIILKNINMTSLANEPRMDSTQFNMIKSLRSSMKSIVKSQAAFDEIKFRQTINGTFKKLCDNYLLTEILFPGATTEVLRNLPKTLREILSWEDLEIDIIQIAKNAADVLNNIKAKGLKLGDVMDEQTEIFLVPQIALEALANGIVTSVRNLNRKASNLAAKLTLSVASTSSEKADFDQLEDSVVNAFISGEKHSVQCGFLGKDWSNLIFNDTERYFRDETASDVDKFGAVCTDLVRDTSLVSARMCWIEPGEGLSSKYPAISELVSQLHALPYELNGASVCCSVF
jgi:hypothetical protein